MDSKNNIFWSEKGILRNTKYIGLKMDRENHIFWSINGCEMIDTDTHKLRNLSSML